MSNTVYRHLVAVPLHPPDDESGVVQAPWDDGHPSPHTETSEEWESGDAGGWPVFPGVTYDAEQVMPRLRSEL